MVDTAEVKLEDLGSPLFKVRTRKFARELRRSLWEKHFGFALDEKNYFKSTDRAKGATVVPTLHPPRLKTTPAAIKSASKGVQSWQEILDKPCHPKTV